MGTVTHGTRTQYRYGCRCPRCTEANTLYQRSYRQRTTPSWPPHRYTVSGVQVTQPTLFGT